MIQQPPPPDHGTGYPGYPPQPYLVPGPPDPKLAPRRSNRLPWVLGGIAVLAALLCLGGAVAVGAWLLTSRAETSYSAGAEATAAAIPSEAPAAVQDVGTWPELPALPAGTDATKLRSTGNGPSTMVAFVNDRSEPVIVSWLDPTGQRVEYQRLEPGGTYLQPTYVGHPWLVSAVDGTEIALFQPVAQPSRAVIK